MFLHIRQTLVVMVLVFVGPRTVAAQFDAANLPSSCTAK
jgi:hypothetical protein